MSRVLTIDGPAGAGKSTVAKRAAAELGIRYLDTGAIYRAVAWALDRAGIPPEDGPPLRTALAGLTVELKDGSILVDGTDVSVEIRALRTDEIVSAYSALAPVRGALLGLQRDQVRHGSLLAEGRDVGSVVFPDASVKFFLTASPEARARRRCLERERKGEPISYEETLAAIRERDRLDSERELAPLTCPEGAVSIDTSDMSEDEVVARIVGHVRATLPEGGLGA
ncbi:MAG: (d)CMP kinase [Synergistaceae bacterium]|nr:(d)CMP kinase [Synergistaceae bacterium]